jgi:cytochrome c oxidase assembly protein subunit 15
MFFFPFSHWVGGIVEEHSHRLVGTVVGLLSIVLVLWLHGRGARAAMRWVGGLTATGATLVWYSKGSASHDAWVLLGVGAGFAGASTFWPACEPAPRWLRRLGWILLIAVVIQGLLGGLRVTLLSDFLGVVHGTLAQLFFCAVCAMALFLSRFWDARPRLYLPADPGRLRAWVLATTLLILVQLILGATMRHQRAGLAIPDFPLAYGSWWPATDPASVDAYNRGRLESVATLPIQAFHIHLQLAHRVMAVVIVTLIARVFWRSVRGLGWGARTTRLACLWLGLVMTQFTLGAATIWTGKSADIATAHVAVGALTFAAGALMVILTRTELARPVPSCPARRVEARASCESRPGSGRDDPNPA